MSRTTVPRAGGTEQQTAYGSGGSASDWLASAAPDPELAARLPGGAVIRDRMYGHYYCLVPPGASARWACPAAECLGDSTYLGMPPTDRTVPMRYDSYWIRPLTRPGGLCSARDVLSLVVMGACLAKAQDDDSDGSDGDGSGDEGGAAS